MLSLITQPKFGFPVNSNIWANSWIVNWIEAAIEQMSQRTLLRHFVNAIDMDCASTLSTGHTLPYWDQLHFMPPYCGRIRQKKYPPKKSYKDCKDLGIIGAFRTCPIAALEAMVELLPLHLQFVKIKISLLLCCHLCISILLHFDCIIFVI